LLAAHPPQFGPNEVDHAVVRNEPLTIETSIADTY
jgi:hypothetical protein